MSLVNVPALFRRQKWAHRGETVKGVLLIVSWGWERQIRIRGKKDKKEERKSQKVT